MRVLRRLLALVRVMPRARRNRWEIPRWMWRRPQHAVGMAIGEVTCVLSQRLDPRLKALAEMKAAAMVSCHVCLDIGAALWRIHGLGEAEIRDLHEHETSDAFDELDRLVLRFAEQLSATPAVVDPELRDELVARLGKAAVVDLAYTVAWEHKRARLYLGLGIRPAGFSDGEACARPLATTA